MQGKSFLSVDDLSLSDLDRIFQLAASFKAEFTKTGRFVSSLPGETRGMVAELLFIQPSTRTRASFEIACGRLGISRASLWNLHFSSMAKGESLKDTIECLIALRPNVIILRCNESVSEFLRKSPVPIINAGLGVEEHPTQALVDAFTIQQFNRNAVKGVKVLIVGDVLHSRVANSNLKLLTRLGADLGFSAPKELSPKENKAWKAVKHFESLDSGIQWADVIMCLRVQKEHHNLRSFGFSMAEYRDKYYVGQQRMQQFKKEGILLHPGPALRGCGN